VNQYNKGGLKARFFIILDTRSASTTCPYLKICQLSVGEARSAVPFLAPLKTTPKTHSLTRIVGLVFGNLAPFKPGF